MTATATTPDKEVDPREVPGGGGLNPVNQIVRIVVVRRPASDSSAARESDGPGHSHGLTEDELSAAEGELKKKAAPRDGTSASGESSDARSRKPKTMFEVLTPTDIVVVGREPASVRETKEGRKLCPHDDRNRDTVLRVWTESDTIEYQCDERFEIVKMERAGWKIYGSPENPFERSEGPPYVAREKPGPGGKLIWSWTSDRLPASANNQQYKMHFKIFDEHGNGQLVDPDVVCGDPPPGP
jgi:hypothetical protein